MYCKVQIYSFVCKNKIDTSNKKSFIALVFFMQQNKMLNDVQQYVVSSYSPQYEYMEEYHK